MIDVTFVVDKGERVKIKCEFCGRARKDNGFLEGTYFLGGIKENGDESRISGIILTAKAQEKPQIAEVVAVGPGGIVDGNEVVMTVKVGDKVIYSKYAGTEVKVDGEEYTIVRQNDILATIED